MNNKTSLNLVHEVFKYLFMVVVLGSLFAMLTDLALGGNCKEPTIKYPEPYTIIIERGAPEILKRCQLDENCMDILIWSDIEKKGESND